MPKGFFHVPKAVNEPVKSYAPNSPEKAAVLAAYKKMWNETIDVPMYIGSEEVRTNNTKNNVSSSRSPTYRWKISFS